MSLLKAYQITHIGFLKDIMRRLALRCTALHLLEQLAQHSLLALVEVALSGSCHFFHECHFSNIGNLLIIEVLLLLVGGFWTILNFVDVIILIDLSKRINMLHQISLGFARQFAGFGHLTDQILFWFLGLTCYLLQSCQVGMAIVQRLQGFQLKNLLLKTFRQVLLVIHVFNRARLHHAEIILGTCIGHLPERPSQTS